MAEPYTISAGYSGPLLYDPSVDPEPIIVDVFGLDRVQILDPPPVFPEALRRQPVPFRFTLTASMRSWTTVRSNLAAGVYKWTYVEGALNDYADPVPDLTWNRGFPGGYSGGDPLKGPTSRPWIRSGGNIVETFWFPGFNDPGYPSAEIAQAFTSGKSIVFNHIGGRLDIAYDYDDSVGPAQGAAVFEFIEVPLPPGDGFWAVVYSSLPERSNWPVIPATDVKADHPTLTKLKPGVHHLRFYYINLERKYRWQDYWIWVWRTPPRLGSTDHVQFTPVTRDQLRKQRTTMFDGFQYMPWEIHPTRPPKPPGDKVGDPLIERGYREQPHPTAGNSFERPRTRGNLPKDPEQLGDAEKF